MRKLGEAEIDLDDGILHDIQDLGRKYGLDRIILHGSRAACTSWERSDIDLVVDIRDARTWLNFLDDLGKIRTLLIFDVSNEKNLAHSPDFLCEVSKKGVVIYEKV